MSHEVLYRKYRPHTFAEVAGQEHIVSALETQAKSGQFGHAYLFYGSRGTGKTSVARIFARALGCGEKDLYEIDAASNTSVDDVRELRDGVRTLPFESPIKVYLIDEVHMLSKSAFNALLKTLEEPPAHVVFILATTELHKVPDTIISRCQMHTFHRPSSEVLVEVVKKIAKKEGLKIDTEGARLVAFLGDGSFRDTLGVLQKVLAGTGGEEITAEIVENITGTPEVGLIHNFLQALLDTRADTALEILEKVATLNRNIKTFSRRVLDELRLAMLVKYAPEIKKDIEQMVDKERMIFFTALATHANSAKISAVLKELLESHDQIGTTSLPQIPLELAVVSITEKLKSAK
ncbi:MAG: polymerase subunit gamma/tau [Patescibacteria group bacterium]|nr:polymerase subunit gamma/tau [Patescibacteria group bacterium]